MELQKMFIDGEWVEGSTGKISSYIKSFKW